MVTRIAKVNKVLEREDERQTDRDAKQCHLATSVAPAGPRPLLRFELECRCEPLRLEGRSSS